MSQVTLPVYMMFEDDSAAVPWLPSPGHLFRNRTVEWFTEILSERSVKAHTTQSSSAAFRRDQIFTMGMAEVQREGTENISQADKKPLELTPEQKKASGLQTTSVHLGAGEVWGVGRLQEDQVRWKDLLFACKTLLPIEVMVRRWPVRPRLCC